MEKITWNVPGDGGRAIEVPYIRRRMALCASKTVADFGCLDGNPESTKVKFSTDLYLIPASNTLYKFDIAEAPGLRGKYHRVDLTEENFWGKESFDVGICVSVLEHIGLNVYGNRLDEKGDITALKNMVRTLKKGGLLYVTVPASEVSYKARNWIRSYSPEDLKKWGEICGCAVAVDLFKLSQGSWYQCSEGEFRNVRHYVGPTDINGVGCVALRKEG